jgi:hypothetical protein
VLCDFVGEDMDTDIKKYLESDKALGFKISEEDFLDIANTHDFKKMIQKFHIARLKSEGKRIKIIDKKETEKIGLLGKSADAIVFSDYLIDEGNHGRNKH